MYKYHITINGRDYGFGWRLPTTIDGVNYAPPHEAFCCSKCGEVWARCYVADCEQSEWQFTPWLCEKCGIGTIWIHGVKRHNAALSTAALEREFLIATEYPDAWYFGGWAKKDREFKQPLESDIDTRGSDNEEEVADALASF